MFFKSLDLTTALRPLLLPDETLLFVQDAIPNYQDGHAYLTSHRVCYVATEEPRKYSVALDLKEIDRAEYQVHPSPILLAGNCAIQAGFLRSSPKITIYPKPQKGKSEKSRSTTASPAVSLPATPFQPNIAPPQSPKPVNATWICAICTFSNPVPSNFDPLAATAGTHVPPCLACGIKPPFTTVLKAAISAVSTHDSLLPELNSVPAENSTAESASSVLAPLNTPGVSVPCLRCTFVNHPSLAECEICGAPLTSAIPSHMAGHQRREDSPAPFFESPRMTNTEITENIKLSFRGSGEKTFYERLKGALIQRKWLLQNAPPVPPPSQASLTSAPNTTALESPQPKIRPNAVGIAGLEQRRMEARMNNQLVIGGAFEDLEALMASAKQIVALAETLAQESGMVTQEGSAETSAVISQSAAALGMVTTKDMLSSGSENLYLSELSRDLAEYLTDDRKGVLQREGGIISLIDLWSVFNRSRNGVELISPSDFQKAAELWEKLKLPVRLRRFKSGLLVVQRYDWSDEKTVRQLLDWMEELRKIPPDEPVPWDWTVFGRAVTAQEAGQRFRWSVGVAAEELEMAEDRGVLCREEGIEGLQFWGNYMVTPDSFSRILGGIQ
ncbi:hypothetical protein N7495_007036 [Penicillium taxi]|uniref:uncharacterized protein n=1 Tax=Penicillium taxi TaxID=168475 RepID=UPI00254561E0|nr:uncharacterized protein N7495_007036 [Penicillium taxi]KAJ5895345.1 hypothetical protein N7495_007036 [Penicillium taxi]